MYENHPFRKELPLIRDINFIHHEQSEGILVLVSKGCLLFFAISWASLEFLGGHRIAALQNLETWVRGIQFVKMKDKKRYIYVSVRNKIIQIRIGLNLNY